MKTFTLQIILKSKQINLVEKNRRIQDSWKHVVSLDKQQQSNQDSFWLSKEFVKLGICETMWTLLLSLFWTFLDTFRSFSFQKYQTLLQQKNRKTVFCYQNCSDLLWEKNCSSDWEKLLKLEAEGQELAKVLKSL